MNINYYALNLLNKKGSSKLAELLFKTKHKLYTHEC